MKKVYDAFVTAAPDYVETNTHPRRDQNFIQSQEFASKLLSKHGVKGIIHERSHSLNGSPTHNVVIFDHDLIRITHRNGVPVQIAGHSQPLSSPVETPLGPAPIGSLRRGHVITSPHGGTMAVRDVFPQGRLRTFRVTLADGRSEACSEDHLWLVDIDGKRSVLPAFKIRMTLFRGQSVLIPTVPA